MIQNQDAAEWIGEGFRLLNEDRYSEALSCFDKAIELDPSIAAAWNNRGFSLQKLGRHTEAIQSYDRVIELEPEDPAAYYN